MVLALIYVNKESNQVTSIFVGFVVTAIATELILQKVFHREIKPRITT